MQSKCLGDAVNNGGRVLPVTLSSPCWALAPGSRSGLVEVRGGSLPWPTPLLGSRLPSPHSLLPSSRRGPRQVAPSAPWCAAASVTPALGACGYLWGWSQPRCLQRDPSPPPVIGPSSRLATLQVAYLGPGTAAVSSRARAGPRSHADTHTTRTHVQGWSVFPRVCCSRVTWSPQGTCAYLGAQADGRAAGRAGAQGLELGWARSALTEDLLLPSGKWACFVPVP